MTEKPWTWPEAEWRGAVSAVRAGRPLAPRRWPGGARCAVALSFDCDHECFELGAGGQAVGRLAWGEFGRRVGVPRILRLLAGHGIQATFFMPAVSALLDPSGTQRIAAEGHEVAVHGWIHENTTLLSPATERELMLRARDALAALTGAEPVGHRAAQWDLSRDTVRLVAELGFLYDSSMMADEECYEVVLNGTPSGLVEVPVEWMRDDAAYLLFNRTPATRPYVPPDAILQIFIQQFDDAYAENGLYQLVMHPFVIGYRGRLRILDGLIRHAQARGGVWFGSHAAVARWVLEQSTQPT